MADLSRPQLIEAAERREFVLNMRKSGATYRQIAAATIQHFGVEQLPKGYDERYAWMDVKAELDRIRDNVAEAAEQVRTLEAERLDKLFLAMYTQASKGNQGAVDRCLRIMERRAKLYGLDTPSKHEVTGADGDAMEIIVRYVDSD